MSLSTKVLPDMAVRGPIHATLLLARAALGCDWVAITQAQGEAMLKVIDSTSDVQLVDLDLTVPAGDPAVARVVDLGGGRASSAWTLACGRRPALVWLEPLPDCGWVLVVACSDPGTQRERVPLVLGNTGAVLAGLFHGGERARAQQLARDRVAELIRHIELPVVFLDDEQANVFMNPAARALLVLPMAAPSAAEVAVALRQVFSRLPSTDDSAAADVFSEQIQPFQIGSRHWEMRARRIDSTALSGWLWLFNDTTTAVGQQRLVMEGLRAETMSRIIGGVAHQFNNLLTVVLGGAEMVSLDPDLPPHVRQTLVQVIEAADRGAAIVSQLRVFGQRGLPGQGRQTIALAPALAAMLPVLQGLVSAPVRLDLLPVDAALVAEADPELFTDVMVNLVANARESMTGAGAITVSAQAAALSPEQVGALALQFHDAVLIRVSDSGSGMDAAVRSRAFEPFFTTRGMASARGLGLSVVEGWARGTGGCARIESAPGAGTLVELVLPRHRSQAGAQDPSRPASGPGPSAV